MEKKLNSLKISVPGDPSSGAFFSALTILKKNSSMKITNIGLNPTRIGFYKLLKSMELRLISKILSEAIMNYMVIFM